MLYQSTKLFTAPKQSTDKVYRFSREDTCIRAIIPAIFLLYAVFQERVYKALGGMRALLTRNL